MIFLIMASLFLGTPNMEVPQLLIKVISAEAWEKSQESGVLFLETMDSKDGYIHMATEEQVLRVIQKFWNGKGYILLHLDPSKFNGTLKYESNPGGESKYYHLYDGSIPLSAVTKIIYS